MSRAGRPAPRVVRLAPDALDQAVAQVGGRHQQVVEAARLRVAGEHVEQLGEVLADGLAAGEEPEVRVDAGRADVVVAGGEVAVAADPVRLLADDQARLAVRLVADQPVHHVGADLLQRARPADVGLLVEAGAQLDQDGDLLAVLGRPR